MLKILTMHKKLFLLLSVVVITLCGCSTNDEPIIPEVSLPELTDQGYLPDAVSDAGAVVSVTFDINTDWYIYSNDGIEVVPSSGGKGKNTVNIAIPQNFDTEYNRGFEFTIYSSNNNFVESFSILQDKAPLLNLKDNVEIPQDESTTDISVKANGEFTVVIPQEAQSWLSCEITPDESKYSYFNIALSAKTNPEITDREALLAVKLGSVEKELTVVQKGGIILTSSLVDKSTSQVWEGMTFSVSPKGGEYILTLNGNCPWDYKLDTSNDYFDISESISNGNSKTFDIVISELPKDAIWKQNRIDVNFVNGDTKQIVINQDDWGITLYVYNNKNLSDEIEAARSKLKEGYFIDNIVVNGGNIDCYAPSTVRSVSISNIENIREGFCERCDNLTSISLSNVKKIGARAFLEHKCRSLSIPSSVTYIGDRAFLRYGTGAWYPYVTSYNPTPPTLGSWVFHDGTGSGVLKVPMGSKPKYKANSSWNKQFDIFEEF